MIDSVYRSGKNDYPQLSLEECEYVVKEKKISEYITHNITDHSDEENLDQEISNEENSNEEN